MYFSVDKEMPRQLTRQMSLGVLSSVCLVVCGVVVTLTILAVNNIYNVDKYLTNLLRKSWSTFCFTEYYPSDDIKFASKPSTRSNFQSEVASWSHSVTLDTEYVASKAAQLSDIMVEEARFDDARIGNHDNSALWYTNVPMHTSENYSVGNVGYCTSNLDIDVGYGRENPACSHVTSCDHIYVNCHVIETFGLPYCSILTPAASSSPSY